MNRTNYPTLYPHTNQWKGTVIDVLHFTVTVPSSIMNKTYNSVINKKTTGDVILHVMVFVNNVNIQIFDR